MLDPGQSHEALRPDLDALISLRCRKQPGWTWACALGVPSLIGCSSLLGSEVRQSQTVRVRRCLQIYVHACTFKGDSVREVGGGSVFQIPSLEVYPSGAPFFLMFPATSMLRDTWWVLSTCGTNEYTLCWWPHDRCAFREWGSLFSPITPVIVQHSFAHSSTHTWRWTHRNGFLNLDSC